MFKKAFFQQYLLLILVVLGLVVLVYNFIILIAPISIVLTILSFFIYKRDIILPEKYDYTIWLSSFLFIVLVLFIANFVSRNDQKKVFGQYFVDGKIENVTGYVDIEEGNGYFEEREIFIPSTPKGKRLMTLFEYIILVISALSTYICYRIYERESKNTNFPFWYLEVLQQKFQNDVKLNYGEVPTNEYRSLFNYYQKLDGEKYWKLKQKLKLQLCLLIIRHNLSETDSLSSWTRKSKSCLALAKYIINDVVFSEHIRFFYRSKDLEKLPFEKTLILKAISYYICESKVDSFSSNRKEKMIKACLYDLFYNIQSDDKNMFGRQVGKSTKQFILDEVFKKKIDVLIVDDHAIFRKTLKSFLNKDSSINIVGEAENGKELEDLLQNKKYDVVTLGIQMPVMDGLHFLQRFNFNEYPKIFNLSFLNDIKVINASLKNGASSYLGKSRDNEELTKGIKSVFAFGFYYSDDIKRLINENSTVE